MSTKYKKVFVTVGTTRFDLLVHTLMESSTLKALKVLGCEEITIQMGNSVQDPGELMKEDVKINLYRFKDSLQDDINNADLVISHAGAGSCLESLEAAKPLLVVVNEELMDNHQLELAEQLQIDGHLYYCTCDTLENTLEEVDFDRLKLFPKAEGSLFSKYLDEMLTVKQSVD